MDREDAQKWLESGQWWAVIDNGVEEDTLVALFTTEEQANTFVDAYKNSDYYIQQLEEV